MGCLQSKNGGTSEIHNTNVFRVTNLDENSSELCQGKLEITETDIILYRDGRDSVVWPLHSLRRYGFEGDLFSFESGRRCETGEGIYAFKCQRAATLFRTLQQQIQLRNVIHDSVPYPVSRMPPSPQGQVRQTLQAHIVHRSSVDHGHDSPDNAMPTHNNNLQNNTTHVGVTHPPQSPSTADILEVMPLYPHTPAHNNHVTNVYQLREFKREHNNNQRDTSDPHHVYSNDLNRDLAVLRNTLRQESVLNTMRDIEDETRFLESRYIDLVTNNTDAATSPTLSNYSEHYAQLSLEEQKESARMYMNIAPQDKNVAVTDVNKNDSPTTPLTPKQVDYCNLNVGPRPEINTYANLSMGDMADSVKNAKLILNFNPPEQAQKLLEFDTFTSMSPVEELDVNYAVLDIDSNKEAPKTTREIPCRMVSSEMSSSFKNESLVSCAPQQPRGRLISQTSFEKASSNTDAAAAAPLANVGYTTIDFDKTVALTSVAACADVNLDGPRKTRHNSITMVCGSPSSCDKNKSKN